MAVVLSGAVIIKQEGSQITYKNKCEKCGWVDSSTTTTSAPNKNSTRSTSFTCQKCRNDQRILIQGT
jgi:hypothetical protein